MKKRLVSLALAAIMVISMAACGNNQTTDVTKESEKESVVTSESTAVVESETTSAPAETTYPIVAEPVTITGAFIGGNFGSGERNVWTKLSELTGINIEWISIETDALPTYLAANKAPDIIIFNGTASSSILSDFGVGGGKFLNYLDYLDVMPNLTKAFEDYPITKAALTEMNGEAYAFPFFDKSATFNSARPLVREDILTENGLEIPKTVDDFYNCLKVLKENTGEAQWIPYFVDDESMWKPMVYAAFGTETNLNFDDDGTGKVVFNRTSEQMKRFLTFMNKLYEEELIHQEYLTLEYQSHSDLSKNTAFLDAGSQDRVKAEDAADGQFHIKGVAPLTSEYDNTQTLVGKMIGSAKLLVSAETEYPEEVCRMLDVAYATEDVEGSGLQGMSFSYGLEGENWTINETDKTWETIFPSDYSGNFNAYRNEFLIWANFGRADAIDGMVTSTPGNSRERQLAFVESVNPYMEDNYFPTKNLKFTEDEQYVMDNKLADIKSYWQEMEGKFITGVADIETEWDAYVAEFDKMGIADVLAVYQSSYDRWVAAMK